MANETWSNFNTVTDQSSQQPIQGVNAVSVNGFVPGNASGNLAINNGVQNQNLSAQYLFVGTTNYQLGTSGASIPLLSAANTWGASQAFSSGFTATLSSPYYLANLSAQYLSVGGTNYPLGQSGTNYVPYANAVGNVLIGTNYDWSGIFQVRGTSNTLVSGSAISFIGSNDTATTADLGGSLGFGGIYNGTNTVIYGTVSARKENGTSGNTSGYLTFTTNSNGPGNAERMRITSGGNVLIGTTSDNGSLLQIVGSQTNFAGIAYNGSPNISTSLGVANYAALNANSVGQWQQFVSGDATGQSLSFRYQTVNSGATGWSGSWVTAMQIAKSGNVLIGGTDDSLSQKLRVFGNSGNTTGVWVNNSDERIKKNIRPIDSPLEKVLALADTMRHYEFIDEIGLPGQRTGYIAQLVEQAGFPGHITEGNPPNEEVGKVLGWEYGDVEESYEETETDEDGNETIVTKTRTVHMVTKEGPKVKNVENNFTPYLYGAIKELYNRIVVLEGKS